MKIGTVFDQTSTNEFLVMLQPDLGDKQLLFSYVELNSGSDKLIARITNVHKENPLLSRDQAGVSAAIDLPSLGVEFSRRFTYGWATCSVIGALGARGLDMNRRGVSPNDEVCTPSVDTLRQLFSSSRPAHIPVGEIETFGEADLTSVPVTMDADQMVTKHYCIFGMTGSGKTNTAAKILEELMARGHHIVVFDSHDDYTNLESLTNIYRREPGDAKPIAIDNPAFVEWVAQISSYIEGSDSAKSFREMKIDINQWVTGRLLQTASLIIENTPARNIAVSNCSTVSREMVEAIWQDALLNKLNTALRVHSYTPYPLLRNYGARYKDFTIHLMESMIGEAFTSPQWRWLRDNINLQGTNANYLEAIKGRTSTIHHPDTQSAMAQKLQSLKAIYEDASAQNLSPLDFEEFFSSVASRSKAHSANVHRLSLTGLSSNARKALLYGVVTYFFRKFKYDGHRARKTAQGDANAYPVLFVLEEARSLIPKTSGLQDIDIAGALATRAMRELAYEGRKFSLGFGLVSQKPSSVDQEVVSQANTFILHQLKSPDDQQYVRAVTESMTVEELDMVKGLGTGRAIITGVAVKSPVLVRMHFRYSEEGIAEPQPLSDELKSVDTIRKELRKNGSA